MPLNDTLVFALLLQYEIPGKKVVTMSETDLQQLVVWSKGRFANAQGEV